MKLLLRRSHRAGLFHKLIYILDVRVQLSDEEREVMVNHALARTRLYERVELMERGRGLFGFLYRAVFGARNLTIRVAELIDGKRIELPDIAEILSVEDQMTGSVRTFNQLLQAAAHYDSDEVVNL
jgi:hypothetical protein